MPGQAYTTSTNSRTESVLDATRSRFFIAHASERSGFPCLAIMVRVKFCLLTHGILLLRMFLTLWYCGLRLIHEKSTMFFHIFLMQTLSYFFFVTTCRNGLNSRITYETDLYLTLIFPLSCFVSLSWPAFISLLGFISLIPGGFGFKPLSRSLELQSRLS